MKKSVFVITVICVGLIGAFFAENVSAAGIGDLNLDKALSTEAASADAAAEQTEFVLPEGVEIDDNITIADGIYCGSISLGGLCPSEAKQALEDFYKVISTSTFTITAGTDKYETTLENLGLEYNLDGVVEEAAYLGHYGLLIERYKKLADLKADKVVIDVKAAVSEDKLASYIKKNIAAKDTPAKDASITRKNGEFIVTSGVVGQETDIEATIKAVNDALAAGLAQNMSVEAVVVMTQPEITTEALSSIKDKLGTFTTNYSTSAAGRKNNLKVACENINGTVVMPGESFSTSTTIKPRTKENGYQIATEYNSGESVEAYGGGVCQVATTLYNAVLRAELQVDKRYNHSMLVSYVEPSFDAAIANGSKDFVFTNNGTTPIYIAGSADGENITFTIYGKETRSSSRTIEFESVIVSRKVYETQVIEDPSLPAGTIEKKGSNHDEVVSYIVKKIYENGKLTDTVKFEQDEYQGSHQIQKVGTGPAVTDSTASDEASSSETSESSVQPSSETPA